mmetsp:Transcript_32307/g.67469  ORF Transcript_32307/g.67469 Transcript_32307/m.67469 type:complete len:345 (-) Transcript_32307:384-1418(-)
MRYRAQVLDALLLQQRLQPRRQLLEPRCTLEPGPHVGREPVHRVQRRRLAAHLRDPVTYRGPQLQQQQQPRVGRPDVGEASVGAVGLPHRVRRLLLDSLHCSHDAPPGPLRHQRRVEAPGHDDAVDVREEAGGERGEAQDGLGEPGEGRRGPLLGRREEVVRHVEERRRLHARPGDEYVGHRLRWVLGPHDVRLVARRGEEGVDGVEGPPHDAVRVHPGLRVAHVRVHLHVEPQRHQVAGEEGDGLLVPSGLEAVGVLRARAEDWRVGGSLGRIVAAVAEDGDGELAQSDAVLRGDAVGVLLVEGAELQAEGEGEVLGGVVAAVIDLLGPLVIPADGVFGRPFF